MQRLIEGKVTIDFSFYSTTPHSNKYDYLDEAVIDFYDQIEDCDLLNEDYIRDNMKLTIHPWEED